MLTIVLLFSICLAEPDYKESSLYTIIERAEVIIYSKIIDQTDSTITLRVLGEFKGSLPGAFLEVRKYRDWPCSSRYTHYEIGQEQIFMLDQKPGVALLEVTGMGNEGELVIDSSFVYYKSYMARESAFHARIGRLEGFRFDLASSLQGIKRIVALNNTYQAIETQCEFMNYPPISDIEHFILEEHAMFTSMHKRCNLDSFTYKVINTFYYRQ